MEIPARDIDSKIGLGPVNRAEKMHDSAGWHIHSQLQEASAEICHLLTHTSEEKKPEPMPAGLAGEDPQGFPPSLLVPQ